MRYSPDDVSNVIRLPFVDRMLRRNYAIRTHDYDLAGVCGYGGTSLYVHRELHPFQFLGEPVEICHLVLHRAHVEKSLLDALTICERDEINRLMALLLMVPDDDPRGFARTFAMDCEDYAITSYRGPTAAKHYRTFVTEESQRFLAQSQAGMPGLRPPDLEAGSES